MAEQPGTDLTVEERIRPHRTHERHGRQWARRETDLTRRSGCGGDGADRSPRVLSAGEVLRVLMLALFIVGAFVLVRATPWGRDAMSGNVDRFRDWLQQWGRWSSVAFLVVGAGVVSIGFPRILLAAIAGALFPLFWGIVLAQVTMTLAIAPAYYYTRFAGREMAVRRMGNRLQRLDGLVQAHGFTVFLLIRLCPVGNAFLTNCIAGVTGVGFGAFALASFLGYLPETIIFALFGGSFADNSQLHLWVGVVLLVLFSLGFIWFFKKSAFAARILSILREE